MKRMTIEECDAAIKRWRTKFRIAVNRLDDLERIKKRLVARHAKEAAEARAAAAEQEAAQHVTMIAIAAPEPVTAPANPEPVTAPGGGDDIPGFLRRGVAAQKAVDKVIADQIIADEAERKKTKAAGQAAKRKAKARGDLKKMPLTGKAALDAIRNG